MLNIMMVIGENLIVTALSKSMYEYRTDKKLLLTIFSQIMDSTILINNRTTSEEIIIKGDKIILQDQNFKVTYKNITTLEILNQPQNVIYNIISTNIYRDLKHRYRENNEFGRANYDYYFSKASSSGTKINK